MQCLQFCTDIDRIWSGWKTPVLAAVTRPLKYYPEKWHRGRAMGTVSYWNTSSSFEIHTHKIDRKHVSVYDKLNISFVPQKSWNAILTVGRLINETKRNVDKMPNILLANVIVRMVKSRSRVQIPLGAWTYFFLISHTMSYDERELAIGWFSIQRFPLDAKNKMFTTTKLKLVQN
jgi:hypothetical protein